MKLSESLALMFLSLVAIVVAFINYMHTAKSNFREIIFSIIFIMLFSIALYSYKAFKKRIK